MTRTSPALPQARGVSSAALIESIRGVPGPVRIGVPETDRPLVDEDLQLTLYLLYELHYQGFAEVDRAWEWEPSLVGLRVELERRSRGPAGDAAGR